MVTLEAVIAALLVAFIYSAALYKHNIFSRFAALTMTALGIAQIVVAAIESLQLRGLAPIMTGSYALIIPMILGPLIFLRMKREYAVIGRLPIAILIGAGAGVTFRGTIDGGIIGQIKGSITNLTDINGVLVFVMVIVALTYWFSTVDRTKGPLKYTVKYARYILMAGFGATFANLVMARFSRFTSLVQIILNGLGFAV